MKFQDIQQINSRYADELKQVASEVIDSGWYLLGERVATFERDLSLYLGCSHVVACANGLDALRLILRGYIELGRISEGDEVIVPANTYIATVLAVTDNRLVPVFVEPSLLTLNLDTALIEQHITARTRAILPVHLYGRTCWDSVIIDVAHRYNLLVIEDAAQALGANSLLDGLTHSRKAGALGHAAGISFYPSKNLGALGDSGAVATNDEVLAGVVRALANYGSQQRYYNSYQGLNSRMDELQAAFLSVKLRYLDDDNRRRRELASIYNDAIIAHEIQKTTLSTEGNHIYHQYIVRTECRNRLIDYLQQNNIPTQIHYPIPPHKQSCYTQYNSLSLPVTEQLAKEVLSLPISQVMTDDDALFIAETINKFSKM